MKRILILQITINIIGLIVFVLLCLGKMVEIKYNYDDPMVKADAAQASYFLYSILREFGILFSIIVLFNLIVSIVIKKRSAK